LNGNRLFSLDVANGASSIATDFPCINIKPERGEWHCKTHPNETHFWGPTCEFGYIFIEERHYYISKGYPRWHPSERGESTKHWDWASIDEAREKNWKVIEPEWNIFIEQLKKEGRYRE
jgi:hypothetical protein